MNFELVFAENLQEAIDASEKGARWFAGGTDLIPEMKMGFVSPTRLINLKRVDELRGIHNTNDGVRIGALATLTEIAESRIVRERYRALAQACDLSASPQIRNMGTIAGNLNQDSRCPYFRNRFPCYLHGGKKCFMRDGENREGAVIGYRDCVHVHPSDPANALVVFDAQIVLRGGDGERVLAAQDFFRAPDAQDTRMNVLREGEMIAAILLPTFKENTRSAYVKAMDRAVWTFALASAAVKVEIRKSRLANARVVFGGVAPIPYCDLRVDKTLSENEWNEELVTQGRFEVLEDAEPLAHNAYKIRLARGLVKRALQECLKDV